MIVIQAQNKAVAVPVGDVRMVTIHMCGEAVPVMSIETDQRELTVHFEKTAAAFIAFDLLTRTVRGGDGLDVECKSVSVQGNAR